MQIDGESAQKYFIYFPQETDVNCQSYRHREGPILQFRFWQRFWHKENFGKILKK